MPKVTDSVSIPDSPEQDEARVRNPNSQEPKREKTEEELQAQSEMLNALGRSLAKTRSEAIDARAVTGIENEWLEDQDQSSLDVSP